MDNLEVERFGTIEAWSRELSIHTTTLGARLKDIEGITGKDQAGHLLLTGFYSESVVRKHCADLLQNRTRQVDDSGFFIEGEERYGSAAAWAQELRLGRGTVHSKLKDAPSIIASGQRGIAGKYYAESLVKRLLPALPRADEKGFIVQACEGGQERYGSIMAWSAELGLSEQHLMRTLKDAAGIEGRDRQNREGYFYAEAIVRERCDRLLQEAPQADASGFIRVGDERYGTIGAWAKTFPISFNTIKKRLQNETGITGKAAGGQLHENGFFAESAVRNVCSDLL